MATTNQCQVHLGQLLTVWFANADAAFNVPIDSDNIRLYNTTPTETSVSPNWCILAVANTVSQPFVASGREYDTRIVILLYSRLSKGDDAEASREAAERWINDAEEMLIENLAELGDTDFWHDIEVHPPRRDADRMFWRNFRTSQIVVDLDKK
jgi:hypothetical protein